MIDGHTRLVGLIGWPVAHSLSPVMHNAAFDALGLNWRYVPLPVRPGWVEAAVHGVAALGFRGVNVTVPHKQAVMAGLDAVGSDAAALGAANTLVVEREEVVVRGYNTDGKGFISALRGGGFDPQSGGKAVVVGAGGAARAVVYALLRSGIEEIVVLNRSLARAQALVSSLGQGPQDASRMLALPLAPEALIEAVRAADLLVNATTVGMSPNVASVVWPGGVSIPSRLVVFDLVYNPLETRLLRLARKSGARSIDGLGMLVGQGALAFEMWTGKPAPTEVMEAACRRALGT